MSDDLDPPGDDIEPPPLPRPQPNFWWSLLACLGLFVVQTVGMLAVWVTMWLVWCAVDGNMRQNVDEDIRGLQQSVTPAPPTEDGPPPPALTRRMAVSLTAGVVGSSVAMLLYTWLLTRLVFGREWHRVVGLRRPGLAQVFIAWILFLPGLMYSDEGLDSLLRAVTGLRNDSYDLMSAGLTSSPLWLGLLAVAIGPGVVEELFCRGFLGRGLVGRHGWVFGVFLTSLLFGLLHVEPIHAVITLLMGVGLHYTLATSRSLWVPMLLHATNNAAWVVLSVTPGMTGTPSPVLLAVRYTSAVLLLVLGTWALWSSRAKVVPAGDGGEVWEPRFPTAAVPPSDSGLTTVEGRPAPLPLVLAVFPLAGLVYSLFAR